jgi:hypothetical protein
MRANSLYQNDSTNLFGGIDFYQDKSLESLKGIRAKVAEISSAVPSEQLTEKVAEILKEISQHISSSSENGRTGFKPVLPFRLLTQWQEKLLRLNAVLLHDDIVLSASDSVVVPGQKFTVKVEKNLGSLGKQGKTSFKLVLPDGWRTQGGDSMVVQAGDNVTITVSPDAMPTIPKSFRKRNQYRSFHTEPLVRFRAMHYHDNVLLTEVRGGLNVEVASSQTIHLTPEIALIGPNGTTVQYRIHNYSPAKASGNIHVNLPRGWKHSNAVFSVPQEDEEAVGTMSVIPPKDLPNGDYRIAFIVDSDTAVVTARASNIAVAPGLNVGVIKSYDDTFEMALQQLNVHYKLLDSLDIAQNDLSLYHTIVIDIRAYLARGDLQRHNARLLEYVKNGGNLVVMYHRSPEWKSDYAPFPLTISSNRIADETAPITVLQIEHPLFHFPNRITDEDWSGWVQERGIYFPGNYAKEYVELLSSHDPDEKPLKGGYLVATYGKGTYIYTSYVWYRQLKEAHIGAFKNFANMISLPMVKR